MLAVGASPTVMVVEGEMRDLHPAGADHLPALVAAGMTPTEVVGELPPLELDDVAAAIRFAADAVADCEIPLQPTA